jgi:hypothetical protein
VEARSAVREFHDGVWQADMAFVLFFCSSTYALDDIAEEMARQFPDVAVFGCTTSGEIGPDGYLDHGLCGVSFPRDSFAAVGCLVTNLQRFEFSSARALVQSQLQELDSRLAPGERLTNRFALSLIDGLSIREELISRAFQSAFGDICLVGGSAGDDQHFVRTHVYANGRFHHDAAAIILVATSRPFRTLKIQNFAPMEERLVVTEAEPDRRLVREINGLSAVEEYARVIDADPKTLCPSKFAASPIVILLDGTNYVRAIQSANDDGSLTFYCAIDEGMVLRVASMTDVIANMVTSLEDIHDALGPPALLIGFDCILRKLNIASKNLTSTVERLLNRYNSIGFSGYGEQYNGIHVNHTLTGLAIGDLPEDA